MNERIDRLIDQCTMQGFSDCVGGYEIFDKEKFAELIVLECSRIAKPKTGSDKVCDAIEQHFGIKE